VYHSTPKKKKSWFGGEISGGKRKKNKFSNSFYTPSMKGFGNGGNFLGGKVWGNRGRQKNLGEFLSSSTKEKNNTIPFWLAFRDPFLLTNSLLCMGSQTGGSQGYLLQLPQFRQGFFSQNWGLGIVLEGITS